MIDVRLRGSERSLGLLDVLDARAVQKLGEVRARVVRLRGRRAERRFGVVEIGLRDEAAPADLGAAVALLLRVLLRRFGAGERRARGVDRLDARAVAKLG